MVSAEVEWASVLQEGIGPHFCARSMRLTQTTVLLEAARPAAAAVIGGPRWQRPG